MDPKVGNWWKRVPCGEALVIAGATALGYCVAYLYQKGFLAAFGVPEDFVYLGLALVVKCTLGVVITVAYAVHTAALLMAYFQQHERAFKKLELKRVLVVLLLVIPLAGASMMLAGIALTVTLLCAASLVGITYKIATDKKREGAVFAVITVSLFVFVTVQGVEAFGRRVARRQTTFLVVTPTCESIGALEGVEPAGLEQFIAVQVRGDNYLCVRLDGAAKTLLPTIRVIRASSPGVCAEVREISGLVLE